MNPVAPVLTQDEAFARIRLLRSPNIGPISFRQLLARFGTACAALDALPDLAARGWEGLSRSASGPGVGRGGGPAGGRWAVCVP